MDDTDIALVLNLLQYPEASNKELAALVEVSQSTVSRRLNSLFDQEVLKGKSLNPNYDRLGLKLYTFILIPDEPYSRHSLLLQLFFKSHSYTAYRNTIYGRHNGLLVQLSLPNSELTETLLLQFLEEIKEDGIVADYVLFIPRYSAMVYLLDTTKYDIRSREFSVDYVKMEKIMRSEVPPLDLLKGESEDQSLLDPKNLQVIRELYDNGSRSLKEIGQTIGNMSKQEVSRRMKQMKVDEWGYVMRYDRQQFGVFNQAFFVLNQDEHALAALDRALGIFPFQATIYPGDNDLFLWINLPAVDVTKFVGLLKERFSKADFYLLGRNSKSYPPWEANLNGQEWIINIEKLTHSFDRRNNFVHVHEFFESYSDLNLEQISHLIS